MPTFSTTSKGYPYIAGTQSADLIDDYALELATKINSAVPYAVASGSASLSFSASNEATLSVNFPVGRFTVAPNVMATINGLGLATTKAVPRASGISSTSFTLAARTGDNTTITGSITVAWFAVQMLSNAADG